MLGESDSAPSLKPAKTERFGHACDLERTAYERFMRQVRSKFKAAVTPASCGLVELVRLLARQAAREAIASDAASEGMASEPSTVVPPPRASGT